jgi:ABC-type uncharacterized transport system substrate-binding protein
MSALPALAVDVLIVQSGNGQAYAEAVKGFREVYRGSTQTILLSDYAEVDLVRLVKEERPRLVLAVGDPALEKSRKVRQVPVVAVMALSFNLQKPPAPNIHGVSVVVSPAKYLELLSTMGAKRIGVLYDPARSGFYLKRAREAAESKGVKLVAHEVRNPREVMNELDQLKGSVDAVWMLPDATAVTSETVEAYFTLSMKQQLPVVSFSERHLSRGAAAAIDVDRVDMGRQAGELVVSILRDGAGYAGSSIDPRKLQINTNKSVLKKLELSFAGN